MNPTKLSRRTLLLAVGVILLLAAAVVAAIRQRSLAVAEGAASGRETSAPATPTTQVLELPDYLPGDSIAGVGRDAMIHTELPAGTRHSIVRYTVKAGDTAWSISQEFGLKPETILWGNPGLSYIAASLSISETLNILPTDGVLHVVKEDDDWDRIELLYGVPMTNVVSYPANGFSLDGPFDLAPGQELIIPGGKTAIYWVDPGPQVVPGLGRQSPGYYSGPLAFMGSGIFIWPVAPPIVINQDYWDAHPAIDIDVYHRQPIFASDSGTVIYAGWSQAGYGNLVIIDHGNDFWTYYAHNEAILVSKGQGVLQGQQIAEGGTTGNSTGNHLDFRIRYKAGNFHNPFLYLPPLP